MAVSTAVADAGGAAPPAAVGGMVVAGVPLQDWVLLLTAIYTIVLIIKNGPAAYAVLKEGVKQLWQKVARRRTP